jgi:hypothetical protein
VVLVEEVMDQVRGERDQVGDEQTGRQRAEEPSEHVAH